MAKTKKKVQHNVERKPSKRDRRMKMVVYLMIVAMLGSIVSSGLAYIF
ncbi:stressosome-associated protein Prli42 [Amphibacillus sp. MSJ-3]|nr:stressosome-associated protein Prli42 [Amphibacillus sp. MSJ-3]MBU5594820.1 stressosome-associated protein Prli42 [Amphibacillus sp. MSJ-3]